VNHNRYLRFGFKQCLTKNQNAMAKKTAKKAAKKTVKKAAKKTAKKAAKKKK
jgi:hypothetical protein